jgi:hypothetical protein
LGMASTTVTSLRFVVVDVAMCKAADNPANPPPIITTSFGILLLLVLLISRRDLLHDCLVLRPNPLLTLALSNDVKGEIFRNDETHKYKKFINKSTSSGFNIVPPVRFPSPQDT